MKTNILVVAIASALIGAGTLVSVQTLAQPGQYSGPTQAHSSSASMRIHKAMMSMGSMKMTGDVDRDFAMMMAEHHENAVKMMDIYLKNGKSSTLKDMARKMRAAQTKEIAQLRKHAKMNQ